MSHNITVRLGQIWRDADKRCAGDKARTLRVCSVSTAYASVHCAETNRYSYIHQSRLTNPKLYTFVREKDAPAAATTENDPAAEAMDTDQQ